MRKPVVGNREMGAHAAWRSSFPSSFLVEVGLILTGGEARPVWSRTVAVCGFFDGIYGYGSGVFVP